MVILIKVSEAPSYLYCFTIVKLEELHSHTYSEHQVCFIKYLQRNQKFPQDLYEKCKIDELESVIVNQKWSWIGHTLRRSTNEIEKQALDWRPA